MSKRCISVLGAGWFGLDLAQRLAKDGFEVKTSASSEEKNQFLKNLGFNSYLLNLDSVPEMSDFFNCDVLVLTVPPGKNQVESKKRIKSVIEKIKTKNHIKVIYISSTSVYPDKEALMLEDDAESIVSTHSSVRMKDLEDFWIENLKERLCILRFGGLFGKNRNPANFFKNRKLRKPNAPVNVTHLSECIEAVLCVIEQNAWNEIFNVVNPENLSRKEFYSMFNPNLMIDEDSNSSGKRVSSEKIVKQLKVEFLDYKSAFDSLI